MKYYEDKIVLKYEIFKLFLIRIIFNKSISNKILSTLNVFYLYVHRLYQFKLKNCMYYYYLTDLMLCIIIVKFVFFI